MHTFGCNYGVNLCFYRSFSLIYNYSKLSKGIFTIVSAWSIAGICAMMLLLKMKMVEYFQIFTNKIKLLIALFLQNICDRVRIIHWSWSFCLFKYFGHLLCFLAFANWVKDLVGNVKKFVMCYINCGGIGFPVIPSKCYWPFYWLPKNQLKLKFLEVFHVIETHSKR